MFFYDPQDTSNSVAIKPLTPPELKIIKVIDKDCKSVTSINANEEYTYIASQKGNDITQLKWCFWIDKRDDDFDKEYTIEITATTNKADVKSDFFLTSKAEGDKKKENTKLLKENAILSATITTETHDIGGKQQEVAVLKVKYSKWLDGEKVRVEIYKYNDKNKKPTRNSSKDAVCSRTVIAKPEVAEVYWMAADGEKLEETGYSEDIYLFIKTLGLKDKTLELNVFDEDITPKPFLMQNKDDYVAWSGNKIKVENRDSIKQFKVGSKERYKDAQKNEVEDEKPKQDCLQVNFDFNSINNAQKKQDPEILELYVSVNNATSLKLNLTTEQNKFGKIKLTPKEQVVDAFFAIDESEKIIADLPLIKGKNQKTNVKNLKKQKDVIVGQKIKIVAECDNLEGKEVNIQIFEKKPFLLANNEYFTIIHDETESTEICVNVENGYAVADIQLREKDICKTKELNEKMKVRTVSSGSILSQRESFTYEKSILYMKVSYLSGNVLIEKIIKNETNLNPVKWYNPVNNPMLCLYTQSGNYRPRYNVFGKVRKERATKEKPYKINHQGIDLLALPDSNIYSCANGTVVRSSDSGKGYGKIIIIKVDNPETLEVIKRTNFTLDYATEGEIFHSSTFNTEGNIYLKYCHLKTMNVVIGEKVKAGQILGTNGTSGYGKTKDPHLHFEIASAARSSGLSNRCHAGQYVKYKGENDLSTTETAYQKTVAETYWD